MRLTALPCPALFSIGLLSLIGLVFSASAASAQNAAAELTTVELVKSDDAVTVNVAGELFTQYIFNGHAKPILHPVIGPHGVAMTRSYPMEKDVDNEASDHPHQKSLWYTHDNVNGVQFWVEYDKEGKSVYGKILQTDLVIDGDTIRTQNQWTSHAGEVVCSDQREITFGATGSSRHIDFAITLKATHGDAVFGDTKEGSMGIRTNPMLRLQTDEKRGNHTAKGQSINSEGIEGKAMWGKRAKWVDYWAPIDGVTVDGATVGGHTVGIAIMDHPSNPRHPTWWHARHYGLVAANPFGIHDFEKKSTEPGAGDMIIKDGESVTFRYRFLFHEGDAATANIEHQFQLFAK